jgi:hypothetical protein
MSGEVTRKRTILLHVELELMSLDRFTIVPGPTEGA